MPEIPDFSPVARLHNVKLGFTFSFNSNLEAEEV